MNYFESAEFILFLTLGVYALALTLSAKYRYMIFNPIIFSIFVLIGYLLVLDIPYEKYNQAGKYIDFFLQPSIVALAVPMYVNWDKIKNQIIPILTSQFIASICGVLSIVVFSKILGAEKEIILSLAPSSISTPIALEVSKSIGGIPSVTASAVMLTGIIGSMVGFRFLNLARVTNPVSQGLAMGSSAAAMGTMRALQISDKYGVFASVGMIFNGIITAFLAPIVLQWIHIYL